ncbi:carboxypeptidase-like regulatory domain-containing protein [Aquimarina sp. D1M17]|uniref:carboxypeptidase-like regulatory domain-containing protein n=1 Tax=Aquimarina acroporae TaxID=2937283 RepID=UPI0020BD5A37|nr:carboxypeptidase-like regulatory domain-containing protein [Aquimarina acroporae]MCK8522971.1 carboxypeptidase-like regulatory domain-containing protein [Aquimarina acroporae]
MHTIIKFILLGVFLLISFFITGQQDVKTITGRVLDEEDKKPIPFASIYLKDKGIGTTSNEEGDFSFYIKNVSNTSIVVISSIGYGTIERRIDDFTIKENILLSREVSPLDEVIITATKKKKFTAKQIVRKAYNAIASNYPDTPFILEGFVRDLQKEDGNYVEYLECAAKFYNKPISVEKEANVELVGIRSSYISDKNPWNKKWDRKNAIMDLIEDDFIRFDYGPIKGKGGWNYRLIDIIPFNNRLVYKIEGEDVPFQKATLFIDTESFAFIRMELTRTAHKGKSWKRRLSNGQEQVYYNVIFEYQEYNDKMYLKYQKEEDTWNIYDTTNPKKLLFTKEPKKELFINNIIVEGVEIYPFSQNMDSGSSLENQKEAYNPDFWTNYNAPQQTKEISKIEQYLKDIID